jgi:pimeloyl-ACP methyl ester carboxylesterase
MRRRARALTAVVIAIAAAGCAKKDPFDDPYYAAACHGPPLESIEARQAAMEQGYTISVRFGCIEKKSWEAVQRANELVAGMVAQAEREAQEAAARPAQSLAEARLGFHTGIATAASGKALPNPPANLFVRADYTGGEGRTLAAFVTPDPRDGQRHAALVWITGGDSNSLDDFWTPGTPDNDQSASAFRQAGVIMMFPTLRGGNVDTGKKEFFFGEVDDVHAAANRLAKLRYVDPARIYLAGHSTGGTLALLAAETGGRFAGVFAFGPVSSVDRYPADIFPDARTASDQEIRLRSPIHWLNAISTPTYIVEGNQAPSNIGELDELCHHARNRLVHCVPVFGATHFSVLDKAARILAPEMVAGTMGEVEMLRTQDFRGELPAN